MSKTHKYLPSPHNPFVPTDHRYRRSIQLLGQRQRPSPRLDDPITEKAWAYFRELRLCRSDAARERLGQSHPDLAAAHEVYTSAQPLRRAELEARLLARQDDDAIAAKCALAPAAVRWYHDVFFDVRGALAADGYIYSMAIGPKIWTGLSLADQDVFLKALAYAQGPLVIDDILKYFKNPPPLIPSLDGLDSAELKQLQRMLCIRSVILTQVLPTSGVGFKKLFMLRADFGADLACGGRAALRPAAEIPSPDGQEPADGGISAFLESRMMELPPVGPSGIVPPGPSGATAAEPAAVSA